MAFPLQMRRRLPVDVRRLGYSDMDGTKETELDWNLHFSPRSLKNFP